MERRLFWILFLFLTYLTCLVNGASHLHNYTFWEDSDYYSEEHEDSSGGHKDTHDEVMEGHYGEVTAGYHGEVMISHHGEVMVGHPPGEMVVDLPAGDEEPINESPLHLLKDSDPNSPAISFSAEAQFVGPELFFDGHGLSLSKPFRTKSHRFKGGVNWTIYPGTNYSGNALCLISDPVHPVTGNGAHEITVGSIRRGCWCNDSVKMVKPKPRSKLGVSILSGVQFWSERNAEGLTAYTDGRETRFPYPIDMHSFQLLGKWIPWTLYSKSDFTGDSSCLVAHREGGGANYVFTNIPKLFSVSSIQQACVAATSFEFAGVEETSERGGKVQDVDKVHELDNKVQVDDNEVPVMPDSGGAGAGGGAVGEKDGTEDGGGGEITGNEIESNTGKGLEETPDNGDAKERGGGAGATATGGAASSNLKNFPALILIFMSFVTAVKKFG